MENYRRYAIYYAPEPGPLATFGAEWLGWDAVAGVETAQLQPAGLPAPAEEITATPRKYGFHGTIKPPFFLAEGKTIDGLHTEMQNLARALAPVTLDGLVLSRLGHFLALTPKGSVTELALLASHIVRELDEFRSPPSPDEVARRRPASLSDTQRALLARWGYPYVMEEFRFHLTLSGRLEADDVEPVEAALRPVVEPILPEPFVVRDLCLFGEADDGRFHQLHRYVLSG
ncbi:phosphonate metabolism protein [Actibacterium mucosum KCTC 23349]|uniref:Phosphonate metabolism protein n=1 Tax=Actibacterium mucosum KCTC 23349 TaxID=1454373 RepID=A0A037ZGU0_9RHOB|nr:DUF1045 domain-containing protein [Actibacterium mucosum]KAJ55675.1 phosphonate metabolism protein [Actibacterium mucosum KCTC 23349]